MRRILLTAIGLLYLLSVPWYRSEEAEVALILGLPDWVAVAIGCYAAVAVLNAAAWLLTDIPDAPAPDAADRSAAGERPEGIEGPGR